MTRFEAIFAVVSCRNARILTNPNCFLNLGEQNIRECDVLSASLYPSVFRDYMRFKEEFGPMEPLHTRLYLTGPEIGEQFQIEIEEGKVLNIKILAIGELLPDGQREVFCEMNGQLRAVFITDKTGVEVCFFFCISR